MLEMVEMNLLKGNYTNTFKLLKESSIEYDRYAKGFTSSTSSYLKAF